jgi:hypothetical protein
MYGADPERGGGALFCELCEAGRLFRKFNSSYTLHDFTVFARKRLRWSQMLYYSQLKAAVRPILEAPTEELAGLGIVTNAPISTALELAAALCELLTYTEFETDFDEENYLKLVKTLSDAGITASGGEAFTNPPEAGNSGADGAQ